MESCLFNLLSEAVSLALEEVNFHNPLSLLRIYRTYMSVCLNLEQCFALLLGVVTQMPACSGLLRFQLGSRTLAGCLATANTLCHCCHMIPQACGIVLEMGEKGS